MAELTLDLDRSSPMPLYFQVARQIEAAIERGELAPGTRLENEVRLAERWGLSRPTLRRAIQVLVDKGLVVRKRGIGTQVVKGHVKRAVQLTSLYDDLARSGKQPTTRVLTHEIVAATDVVAEQLGVEVGTDLLHLRRLRYADGEPLAIMNSWLPTEVAGTITAEQLACQGLYELLRARGVHIRIASQRIGARAATAAEARLLGISKGGPLLTMQRTAYDDYGHPVEFSSHAYEAGTYSFEVMVVER